MTTLETICFLPCRKGSQRIPNKNIKKFLNYNHGLIELKLKQLLQCKSIDKIILSTDDEEILDFANRKGEERIVTHQRESYLSSSQTSTDQLVGHALDLIPEGHILWTHVTSPFINSDIYELIINTYINKLNEGYDSLMTTTEIHGFIWKEGKPINYDPSIEKWPRTQTLLPVHEVNSGAFMASSEVYKAINDRIGKKPYLYGMNKLIGHDIDWPEDFVIAEVLAEKKIVKL